MTTTIFLLGCAVFAAGLHRLGRCDRGELEQAALLPFADDPPAARAMTAATGRVCARVVEPLAEPVAAAEPWRLEA